MNHRLFPSLLLLLMVTASVSVGYEVESCRGKTKCLCVFNENYFVIHCEGKLSVFVFSYSPEEDDDEEDDVALSWQVKVVCNETTPEEAFASGYYSSFDVGKVQEAGVHLSACPEPESSYSSMFSTTKVDGASDGIDGKQMTITRLEIQCGKRTNYSLERKHLLGLRVLTKLTIICHALRQLTDGLFEGTTPALKSLEISETLIEHIPPRLFRQLSHLEELSLDSNRLARIDSHAFRGLVSLKSLDMSRNNLGHLEDSVFESVSRLEHLNIERNHLSTMPPRLRSLSNLRSLLLSNNDIREVKEIDCHGLSRLIRADLADNSITHVDPKCAAHLTGLREIDLSLNEIESLPQGTVRFENLRIFSLQRNRGGDFRVEGFLGGDRISEILMQNSSIVSLHPEFLHSFPRLRYVDFGRNKLTAVDENLTRKNLELGAISFSHNRLSGVPGKMLRENLSLKYLDLSSNAIVSLPSELLRSNGRLVLFDVSDNLVESIPERLFESLQRVLELKLSKNRIHSLPPSLFSSNFALEHLDLGHNLLVSLPEDIFTPLTSLLNLNLEGNLLCTLPRFDLPRLRRMSVAKNRLKSVPPFAFQKVTSLEVLNLSSNAISELSHSPFLHEGHSLRSLDLSFNMLKIIPKEMLISSQSLTFLNLSGNGLREIYLDRFGKASNLVELNLSRNKISLIEATEEINGSAAVTATLKILNLSHNRLNFTYREWEYDDVRKTWGKTSPLSGCLGLEELYLSDNQIDMMYVDWRNTLANLRLLDLRRNKFRYVTHQDLLFSTSEIHADGRSTPYTCSHFMTVDLRENEIRAIELPSSMLKPILRKHSAEKLYGHVTVLVDDNPIVCGCALLNFLRVVNDDAVLTGELKRSWGRDWILPARIIPGNLSCWLERAERSFPSPHGSYRPTHNCDRHPCIPRS